jgi:predicted kinase
METPCKLERASQGVFNFYLTIEIYMCIFINMKKVIIPRGIPGSGKTTWVKHQLATHTAGTAVRISNDDLSFMLYGQPWGTFFFSDATRETLHNLRIAMLETFLKQDAITHIYVDNTNLAVQTVKSLQDVALRYGADFIVDDQFLEVDIEICIERDSKRDAPVGVDVIRKMAKQMHKIKPWKVPVISKIEKYNNDSSLTPAIIVDIDGTLAHMRDRSPYDWSRVSEDIVDENIKRIINLESSHGLVIILSGRDGSCYNETKQWLLDNNVKFFHLYMREAGDSRPDWIIKNEIFQQEIAGKYFIRYVLDDRDQVVDLWRNKLGLPTYQVAEGTF